jgi:hypothetical protein
MKRYLLLLAALFIASIFFIPRNVRAVCPQDPVDLGVCDTLYVETFDCDYTYQATAGYDSVRVAIYVTHDSNTFFWDGGQRWVQDSISGFCIPLKWWKSGCADSVVLPTYDKWNNRIMDRTNADFRRSIFRDLVDAHHPSDTVYNRFADMNDLGWDPWTVTTWFKPDSAMIAAVCLGGYGRWWEGSRALFATLTFLVYMGEDCDSTAICVDSTLWPPLSNLALVRYDAFLYVPRHFLPLCDTIYSFSRGDCNNDGVINSADAVYLISYLFVDGPAPIPVLQIGDLNCDGIVNIADVVYLINYLFVNGPPPCC